MIVTMSPFYYLNAGFLIVSKITRVEAAFKVHRLPVELFTRQLQFAVLQPLNYNFWCAAVRVTLDYTRFRGHFVQAETHVLVEYDYK